MNPTIKRVERIISKLGLSDCNPYLFSIDKFDTNIGLGGRKLIRMTVRDYDYNKLKTAADIILDAVRMKFDLEKKNGPSYTVYIVHKKGEYNVLQ